MLKIRLQPCSGCGKFGRCRQEILANLEHGTGHENHRPFEHVFQFADVARPRVLLQPPHCLPANSVKPLANAGREFVDEEMREQRDVVGPLPKRWQPYGEYIEPIIKVLAELFSPDLL